MIGSREPNTTPKGNKLRRLVSVVEARSATNCSDLLTKRLGTKLCQTYKS